MKPSFLRHAAVLVLAFPALVFAEELSSPPPIGKPATKVYRYVMPDGRIVYSDKPVKGGRIDETITADPATQGKSWTGESGKRPAVPPRSERTPVDRVTSIPAPGKRKTLDQAQSDVTRAEMLLEDARKRQEAGVEPLPGERTGNVGGGSRLNDAYKARQRRLAEEVAEAEAVLKRAIAAQDALRPVR